MTADPVAPALRLHLLGQPCLRRGDEPPLALNAGDAALLAVVALEGPVARQRVALLLWPPQAAEGTGGEQRALNNLRQRLFRLARRAGAEVVASAPGAATLALAAPLLHDLAPDESEWLDGAAEGDLLGGLAYDEASSLGQWVQAARQRWRAHRADRLAGLCTGLETQGRLGEALRLAHRLAAEEPLSEHASRLLMRLHHARGDRGAALAEFDRCKAALYAQLGDAPSDETVALAQAIASAGRAVAAPRPPLPLALRHPPRTIGRETALARAEHRWQQEGVVLLLGAAGIGKSRLMDDLVRRWQVPVQVACRADGAASSLGLAGALAAALAPVVRPHLRGEDPAWLDWLADPAQRDSPRPTVQPAQVRQRLSALLSVAVQHGVQTVAVEDLHHADAASLGVLIDLLEPSGPLAPPEGGARPGVRWLLSCRDNELPPALQLWIERQPLGADPTVRLEPLAEEGTRQFLASLGVGGKDPQAAARLHAHCGGHPLYMLQVLRQLQLAGELDGGGWPTRLPLPDDAMLSAAHRLARADPASQQMAYLAALCGPDFSAGLMCRLMRCSAVDLVAPWRRLEDLHLFGPQGFAHELVREAVLAALPKALAPLLHREIALALDERQGDPLRRARHWQAAGEPARAAAAYEEAAALSRRCGLWQEALDSLAQAEAQHRAAGQADAAFLVDWQRGHGLVEASSMREAAAIAQRLTASARDTPQRARAHELAARVRTEQQEAAALDDAMAALELSRLGPEPAAFVARCRLRAAEALAMLGRAEEALAMLEAPGVDVVDRGDEEQGFAHAGARASILATLGRRREAVATQRAWLDRAVAARNPGQAAFAAGFCATHLAYLGRVREAIPLAEQSLALAQDAGTERGLMLVDEMGLAGNLGDVGRFEEALALGERVIAALQAGGYDLWVHNAAHDRASIYLRLGRIDLAQQQLRAPVDDFPPWLRAARRLAQARVLQAQGREAQALLDEAAAVFGAPDGSAHDYPRQKVTLEARRGAGGEAGIAQALHCIDWARAHEHVALERYARMVAIEALGRAGRLDEAAAHARTLVAQPGATEEAFGLYLPQLLWVAAQALSRGGDRAAATRLQQAAQAWILGSADRHVPPVFRASFLDRNPVNREVLTTRLAGGS